MFMHPQGNARVRNAAPELLAACKGALKIESLWMPPDEENDPNYDEEFAALASMRNKLLKAVALAEGKPDAKTVIG